MMKLGQIAGLGTVFAAAAAFLFRLPTHFANGEPVSATLVTAWFVLYAFLLVLGGRPSMAFLTGNIVGAPAGLLLRDAIADGLHRSLPSYTPQIVTASLAAPLLGALIWWISTSMTQQSMSGEEQLGPRWKRREGYTNAALGFFILAFSIVLVQKIEPMQALCVGMIVMGLNTAYQTYDKVTDSAKRRFRSIALAASLASSSFAMIALYARHHHL